MPLFPPQKYRNVENIHRQGLAADRPAAANVLVGTLYFSTDTLTLERSNGTVWTAYAGTGAIPGPPGPAGPTGAIGPQGGQGSPGVDGSDGEDGAMGSPGPTGARGIQGLQGIQGLVGPFGFDGVDGEEGFMGPVGPRGLTGATGPAGSSGGSSIPGFLSFDGIDGDEGFSIIGARGPAGATGSQGIQGLRGFQGPPGFDGEDGIEPIMMMMGGGMPASPFQSVQFNDGNRFGGNAGFLYDKTDNSLLVGNYVGTSITVIGLGTFGTDKVQVGQIVAIGGDANISGPGIDFNVTADPMRWSIITEKSMYGTKRAMYFKDRTAGKIPAVLYEHPTLAGSYVFGPHPNSGAIIDIGDATLHASNARIRDINAIGAANVGSLYSNAYVFAASFVQAGTNFYEKSRSVPIGHYSDWVPTFTNLTVGNGTLYAKEMRIGLTTFFALVLIFGSTTAVTGPVYFTVPRAGVTLANAQSVARVMVLHGGFFYGGQTWLASPTEHYIMFYGSPMLTMNTTVPITWAENSQLFINGFYGET